MVVLLTMACCTGPENADKMFTAPVGSTHIFVHEMSAGINSIGMAEIPTNSF